MENVNDPIYTFLLRESPSLFVLGAGDPKLQPSSPGFPGNSKYNPSRILLQSNKIHEVATLWLSEASKFGITNCSYDSISILEFFSWLLSFTGGMMLMIPDDMFTKSVFDKHFNSYQHNLTSSDFFESKACINTKARCFNPDSAILFDEILYNGDYAPFDLENLVKFGYLNRDGVASDRGLFVSYLLLLFVYNSRSDLDLKFSEEASKILNTMDEQDKIEAIIMLGLNERYKDGKRSGVLLG